MLPLSDIFICMNKYFAFESGGYLGKNCFRALIVAWLYAFQKVEIVTGLTGNHSENMANESRDKSREM